MIRRTLAALLMLVAAAVTHCADFTTKSWHVDLRLQRDGTLQVVEQIEVYFNKPQRGIYRTIPTNGPNGNLAFWLVGAKARSEERRVGKESRYWWVTGGK